MKVSLPVGGLHGLLTKRNIVYVCVVLLVLGGSGYYLYSRHRDQQHKVDAKPVTKVLPGYNTPNQAIDAELVFANKSLTAHAYDKAVSAYIGAAQNAYQMNDIKRARDLLQTCIHNVPDDNTPWSVYQSLASYDQKAGDINAEKSHLIIAIKKAQQPGSDANKTYLDYMKNRLQVLNK